MTCKFTKANDSRVASQIGATLDALQATIESRKNAGAESYSASLMQGPSDKALKKLVEEAAEVALAAKDVDQLEEEGHGSKLISAAKDHLRYEAGDVMYHLMVVLARYDISLDELAAELNTRMTSEEMPEGGVVLLEEYVNRGK